MFKWVHTQTVRKGPRVPMTPVGTLVLNVDVYVPRDVKLVRCKREARISNEPSAGPWCMQLHDHLIVCKGKLMETFDSEGVWLGELPKAYWPPRNLVFAALLTETGEQPDGSLSHYDDTHLVTLVVQEDGQILGFGHRKPIRGAVDLSAIRFCTNMGLNLVDNVSIHVCDVHSDDVEGRIVVLQGSLHSKKFLRASADPVAQITADCRPAMNSMRFITAGGTLGGYHLLEVTLESSKPGVGKDGSVMWRDARWTNDSIHLSGLIFEGVGGRSRDFGPVNPEMATYILRNFQQLLIKNFGSIDAAWDQVFDEDGSGVCDLQEFKLGCKKCHYLAAPDRVWAVLDQDGSGSISVEELKHGIDEGGHVGSSRVLSMRQRAATPLFPNA
eukprot:CAMPEP_0204274508 /NCGR_PEP_ID=MMETSP0468-20130131/25227_1 /ASSEMBLY_ACC=CAM_ASM_000383 /TAXON_ID=2969 /ORGANISM="Oxyrrhis marina" /LENGTH=384 /DNA_ID=CAMNT_0051250725 /DNA_START=48 /DNA_END=1202 /DNA_ORIENTATION=-